MNLSQVKRLHPGDKFRRPGKAGAWRTYTVVSLADGVLQSVDQYGYRQTLALDPAHWQAGNKEFMCPARAIGQSCLSPGDQGMAP